MKDASTADRQSIVLRIVWMLLFAIGWQVGEILLLMVVLFQLGYRLIYGAPSAVLLGFGDSLSQFMAQIGRFVTFNTDEKPWPFAPWPSARLSDGEAAHVAEPAAHPARDDEPGL